MKQLTLVLAIALLLPAVVVSQDTDSDRLDRWTRDLGADDPDVREQAQKNLQEAGAAAVPALKRALESSDPEVKIRAGRLIQAINDAAEVREIIVAPSVTLARGDHSLADVAEVLRKASGRTIDLKISDPEATVTLGWKDVPFMQALDELCAAHGKMSHRVIESGAVVLSSGSPVAHPVGHSGPIRLDVVKINDYRSTDFDGNKTSNLTITLKITSLHGDAPPWKESVKIQKAVLKDGTELTVSSSGSRNAMPGGMVMAGGGVVMIGGMGGGAQSRQHTITIKGVPRSAKTIGSISGNVTLTLPVGEQEIVFAVDDTGKKVKAGEYTIKLESIKNGAARISFQDETSKNAGNRVIYWGGGGRQDPRHAQIERRMDFTKIAGVDSEGNPVKLKTEWRQLDQRQMRLSSVRGGGSANLPTIEVDVSSEIEKIRLKFKPRTLKHTVPITVGEIPLP